MTKQKIFTDLTPSELIEQALTRNEGSLTNTGALLITTGDRTGRSPNDRFIVDEPSTSQDIEWGDVNKPFLEAK
ncbi:MAG TPA: phosphoenolpyruvate carboxykinase (ATP), partial [Gammaproteobacteria bacterium]|nr:phosphoenolpyruvate carboxykinase (ATP) [Gammaproteobacteria bacterium]